MIIKIKTENKLLDQEVIKDRLKKLKEGYANLAIEGMITRGLTQEQMTEKTNQKFTNK